MRDEKEYYRGPEFGSSHLNKLYWNDIENTSKLITEVDAILVSIKDGINQL